MEICRRICYRGTLLLSLRTWKIMDLGVEVPKMPKEMDTVGYLDFCEFEIFAGFRCRFHEIYDIQISRILGFFVIADLDFFYI